MATARSASILSPLGEPLLALDFLEHRWMASHREEVYSDWLQWIVAQMDPAEVLRVFGVEDPEMSTACVGCPVAIQREEGVKEGHEGFKGRLDLAIRIGEDSLLVVEVKLGAADQADTLKGKGYCRSIDAQHQDTRFRKYVILVIDASSDDYSGFRPRRWADACIELRLIAAKLCRRGKLLNAGMILSFVSAVEQNLLKLCAKRQSGDAMFRALSLPRVTDHLSRFLEADKNDDQ